jgi:hypothetical protein
MSPTSRAPAVVEIAYITNPPEPESRFGPNVRAGFIDAPVNGPHMKASIATVAPTTTATVAVDSSRHITTPRMEAIRAAVIPTSMPTAVNNDTELATTVGAS